VARPRKLPTNGGVFFPEEDIPLVPGADRKALTAGGQRVNPSRAEQYRRLSQLWQNEALTMYDSCGEAWYAAQFYARAIGKLRLYIAKKDEQGEVTELKDEPDDPGVQALERIKDPSGGRSQFQAAWARLMFLTGETYLTVTENPDTEEEVWECLSSNELRLAPGRGYVRYAAPSVSPEELLTAPDDDFEPVDKGNQKTAVVYRLWRRHPSYSMLADAPMRACLTLFEELQLLQLAVRARARSRLNGAGILAVPTEIIFANMPTGAEQDQTKSPVMQLLHRAATTAIRDPGSAAAVVPIVIQGPAEHLKELRWIPIGSPNEKYEEQGLRTELISRIAIGLDFPKEQLLGVGDANHWSAWLVDDQTWSAHLQPMANLFVEDLTGVYLRPYLKKQGVENWADYTIWYDPAEVINNPDRNKDAAALYAQGELSGATWRDAGGFNDDDEPDDEEFRIALAKQFNDPQMLPEKYRPEKPEPVMPQPSVDDLLQDDTAEGEPPPEKDDSAEVEEESQVDQVDDKTVKKNGNSSVAASGYAAELAGVARATTRRARELAGSRLRTRVRKDEGLHALVASVPPSGTTGVAALLGMEKCSGASLGTPQELVKGAGDGFADVAAEFGVDPAIGRRIALMLEEHAAKTLFEENPPPLPPRLRAYLDRVL